MEKHIKKEPKKTMDNIDSKRDQLSEFFHKIQLAKLNREEWVETDLDIINYFNRGGLNGAKYFIYEGIKVCLNGESEDIERSESSALHDKTFGAGVLVNPPA